MMCTSICDKPCSPQCVPYTPTTEEVRLDYAPAKTFPADAEEQFDRWLAEVKAQAWHEGLEAAELGIANPYRQVKITLTHNEIQQLNAVLDKEEL